MKPTALRKRTAFLVPMFYLAFALGVFVCAAGCERPAPPARPAEPAKSPPAANTNVAPPPSGTAPTPPPGQSAQENAPGTGQPATGQPPAAPTAAPSGGAPSAAVPAIPPPPADAPPLKYDVPADWKPETPPAQFPSRKAQYLLPRAAEDKDESRVIVSYFGPGQGGTLAANVERWFGQFSNADGGPVDVSKARTETMTINGLEITFVEIAGHYTEMALGGGGAPKRSAGEYRLLAAIVVTPKGPWFFKGVGPTASMTAQSEAFLKMLLSVRQ